MKYNLIQLLTLAGCVTLGANTASAASLIYEPFSQSAGGLGGQPGGTGLSGNWTTNQTVTVVNPPTLNYGNLANTGGQADLNAGNNTYATITTTSVLADNGLLDNGATLWFSMVYQKTAGGGSNEWAGFVFGSDAATGANGVLMDGTGDGLGFLTRNTSVVAGTWVGGGGAVGGFGGSSLSITYSQPTLLVGRIDWAPTESDNHTITIYNVALDDLSTLGTGVSKTIAGTVDQKAFDTITMKQRNSNGVQTYDEIRFGATYADVSPVPGASANFGLTIAPNAGNPGNYDFSWESQAGMAYDLVSATDLSAPPTTWSAWDGRIDLVATPPTNTLANVPGGGDPRRFFAVVEKEAPPLLDVDFEENDGGFTASTDEGTAWEWGDPDSTGFGGTVSTGNDGSAKCWGTGIGNPGFYANPTTNSRLISPEIDLTAVAAAELTFAQAIDLEGSDSAVVRIYDAGTGAEIVGGDFPLTVTDPVITAAPWESSGPHALPVGSSIRIEWILSGTGGTSEDYIGWYIDDVMVTETTP